MAKNLSEILNHNCLFATNRISVLNWNHLESAGEYNSSVECVLEIMTPKVTKALPDGWQNLNTQKMAEKWIHDRKKDSKFYGIIRTETRKIIGFLFLYPENLSIESSELRLGYLLNESIWGKGFGSELIKGLVEWGRSTGAIDSISGGVEESNIGSIKVLEKNGFYKSDEDLTQGMLLYQFDFDPDRTADNH